MSKELEQILTSSLQDIFEGFASRVKKETDSVNEMFEANKRMMAEKLKATDVKLKELVTKAEALRDEFIDKVYVYT